jgi:hypothetical protein
VDKFRRPLARVLNRVLVTDVTNAAESTPGRIGIQKPSETLCAEFAGKRVFQHGTCQNEVRVLGNQSTASYICRIENNLKQN